jgi:hypothetical protein
MEIVYEEQHLLYEEDMPTNNKPQVSHLESISQVGHKRGAGQYEILSEPTKR